MKTQPAVTSTTDPTPDPDTLIERGREVVRLEAQTIAGLEQRLDERGDQMATQHRRRIHQRQHDA